MGNRYSERPSRLLGIDTKIEGALALSTDWTVYARASEWRTKEEERVRAEHGLTPRPRTPQEIQEAKGAQQKTFEELEAKVKPKVSGETPDAGS